MLRLFAARGGLLLLLMLMFATLSFSIIICERMEYIYLADLLLLKSLLLLLFLLLLLNSNRKLQHKHFC